MKRFFLLLVLICSLSSCQNEPDAEVKNINNFYSLDDLGRNVTFPPNLQRIVSLDQGMTDILYTSGAGKYLVGISDKESFGLFPDSVAKFKTKPLDWKQLKSLKPDLVVGSASNFSKSIADSLTKSGIATMLFNFKEWKDILRVMTHMGYIFGTESRSRTAQDTLNAQWGALQNIMLSGGRRPSVLLATGSGQLSGYGKDSYVNALIEDGGGMNILHDQKGELQPISAQLVRRTNPDFIFITPDVSRSLAGLIGKFPFLTSTNAYRLRKIYLIAPELVLHASPRYIEGAREIAAALFTSSATPLK
jgi:iron complex transport system substrate-binding protein